MLKVALTGGIASGKSLASEHFASLGVPVIDADQVARELVEPGRPALAAIVEHFGPAILTADGTLDRRALRQRIFADAEARRALEAILHPAIRQCMQELAEAAHGPYLVQVIPLLAESDLDWDQDRVLLIDCPETLQRQRLMARDGCSAEQAEAILASQATREQRRCIADDILVNDGDTRTLQQGIETLHARYLEAGSSHD